MVFNLGVGGSMAAQSSQNQREQNAPASPGASTPFQAPQAWAAWNQQPPQAPPPNMPGNAPGSPPTASPAPGTSNHTSPLARTLLGGPGGSPADISRYPPQVQQTVQQNDQFVQQAQSQYANQHSQLVAALNQVARLGTYQNPYSGQQHSATVTGTGA